MDGAYSRNQVTATRRGAFIRAALLASVALLLCVGGRSPSSAQAPAQPDAGGKQDARAGNYHLETTKYVGGDWSNLPWEFSIKRVDDADFDSLTESNIEASLNGQPVAIRPGSLRLTHNDARGVLFMIDRSGSMVEGVNKLGAARESLKTFIKGLRDGDFAAIGSFAHGQTLVHDVIPKSDELIRACDDIKFEHEVQNQTRLYDALDYALAKAAAAGIRDIIFLSDGMDTSGLGPAKKSERKQKIIRAAQDGRIRIFTIALGVLGERGMNGVDYDALNDISLAASGGPCTPIDINILSEEALKSGMTFEGLLERKLDSTLLDIKKRRSYAYELTLNLPADVERKNGALNIVVKVPEGQVAHELKVNYPVFWAAGAERPSFGEGVVAEPVLIEVVNEKVLPFDRVGLYLWMVLTFATLALIPPAADTLTAHGRARRARKSIVAVGRLSPLLSQQCPSEGDDYGGLFRFKEGDNVIVCPVCKTPHHLSCWKWNNNHCLRKGCRNEMQIPPSVLAKYGLA